MGAAEKLGRFPPKNHARTVANMCDLLDAAACYAGVPSLALRGVLDRDENVNPAAWAESQDMREAILLRSKAHTFVASDYKRILAALKELAPRGNRAAWNHLKFELYPGEAYHRRLLGLEDGQSLDALDDLDGQSASRQQTTGYVYLRNQKLRDKVIANAKGRCQYCGVLGFRTKSGRYLEAHHIIHLAKQGPDSLSNLIALCANDHREAHSGLRAKSLERRMLAIIRKTSHSRDGKRNA